MTHDVYTLPPGLPVPEDDGACDHLLGLELPPLTLESSRGPVDLSALAAGLLVVYVYPRTGRPGDRRCRAGTTFPVHVAVRRSRASSATTMPSFGRTARRSPV